METSYLPTLQGARQVVTGRNVKVGIVGLGYWGPKLARNFHSLPDVATLQMAADLSQDRLADLHKLYPEVALTPNYDEMLQSDIDAVVVSTPVYTHYPLAKKALLAGKHVMVEKPITRDSLQARDLIALAKERGLTLMVGHTFEYNPAVEATRDLIQAGELGQIFYMNATRVNLGLLQPDINVMWDLAPHDLSLMSFILGSRAVKVSALGRGYINTSRNLPEVVYMNVTFENDVMANLRVSWLDPVKQRRLTVVGSKKMLVYDDIADNKVVIHDKGVEVPPYSVTEEEFRASYRQGPETVHPFQWVEPLKSECAHFVDCIRTGNTPRSSGESGLGVVKILETAQISMDNGGVELKIIG
jgi:predicted dehydrogenase